MGTAMCQEFEGGVVKVEYCVTSGVVCGLSSSPHGKMGALLSPPSLSLSKFGYKH